MLALPARLNAGFGFSRSLFGRSFDHTLRTAYSTIQKKTPAIPPAEDPIPSVEEMPLILSSSQNTNLGVEIKSDSSTVTSTPEKPAQAGKRLHRVKNLLVNTAGDSSIVPPVNFLETPVLNSPAVVSSLPYFKQKNQVDYSQFNLSAAELHYVFSIIPRAYMSAEYIEKVQNFDRSKLLSLNLREVLHRYSSVNSRPLAAEMSLAAVEEPTNLAERKEFLSRRINMMRTLLGLEHAPLKRIRQFNTRRLIDIYRNTSKDTGSPKVQIANLTLRIRNMEDHLQRRPRDDESKRYLRLAINKRHRLLRYIRRVDFASYNVLLKELEIDHDLFNKSKLDEEFSIKRTNEFIAREMRRKK